MKSKPKIPFIPPERQDTVRHEIIATLTGKTLSAKDISQAAHIPEKEVSGHLEHIQISLDKSRQRLIVTPAQCEHCGFVFKKRERLKKPGKCPLCRSGHIAEPLFSIQER